MTITLEPQTTVPVREFPDLHGKAFRIGQLFCRIGQAMYAF